MCLLLQQSRRPLIECRVGALVLGYSFGGHIKVRSGALLERKRVILSRGRQLGALVLEGGRPNGLGDVLLVLVVLLLDLFVLSAKLRCYLGA